VQHDLPRALTYVCRCVLGGVLAFLGGAAVRSEDLAEAVLRWRADWPGVGVRVPVDVLRYCLEEDARLPDSASAPLAVVLSRGEHTAVIRGGSLRVWSEFTFVVFDRQQAPAIPLLRVGCPWQRISINGKPGTLRESGDWWWLDPTAVAAAATEDSPAAPRQTAPAGYAYQVTVSAEAELRARTAQDIHSVVIPVAPAVLNLLRVESAEAWEVRTPASPLAIVGSEREGTRGLLGLNLGYASAATMLLSRSPQAEPPAPRPPPAQGDAGFLLTWQRPQLPVSRAGQPLYSSWVAWHLDEGAQQVQARLDVRIAGGELDVLRLRLLAGADRLQVRGPDVREVQQQGDVAVVHLKGRIRGATWLDVQFSLPWPVGKGRTSLGGIALEGGRLQGGAVLVSSMGGAVVLEEQVVGLRELDLWEVPDQLTTRAAGPPLLAYALTNDSWRLGVEVVSLAELPVRDTLIDEASHTILLRPDGSTLHKAVFWVRNRNAQFLRLRLPDSPGCERPPLPLLARVAEKPVPVARSPAGELLMPLEKSVQTVAGAVSFPVEVVFLCRQPPLVSEGRLRLLLPQVDLPTARAKCTLYVPEGFTARQWQGAFRLAEQLGAVSDRLEYGRGHKAPTEQPVAEPGVLDDKSRADLLANAYLRAALEAYNQGRLDEAREAARKAADQRASAATVDEARKLIENVELMTGERKAQSRAERIASEHLAFAQRAAQAEVQAVQQRLLREAGEKLRAGKEGEAAEAYRAARQIGKELQVTEKGRRQQERTLEVATQWLAEYEARFKREAVQQSAVAQPGAPPALSPPPATTAPVEERMRYSTLAAGGGRAAPPNVEATGRLALQRVSGKPVPAAPLPRPVSGRATVGDYFGLRSDDPGMVVTDADRLRQAPIASGLGPGLPQAGRPLAVSVRDLASSEAEGRELAEFIARNYDLGGRALGGLRPEERIDYRDGHIVVQNPADLPLVAGVISNLRHNVMQKVTMNARELAVGEEAAAALGIAWHAAPIGRWAIVDEGQLRALLALEQRQKRSGVAVARRQQEVVPGTGVALFNGAVVVLNAARDDSNGLLVNGDAVQLPHACILLVSQNERLVALRAGATQFWADRPETPEIPEVPMEIEVPAIGTPVRFEKMLVRPEDSLIIESYYRYKEPG